MVRPYDPELLDKARAMYEAGSSFAEVADTLGCDTESLRRALIRHGVQPRPRFHGRKVTPKPGVPAPDWLAEAHTSGMSARKIAARAGVSHSIARRWVRESGLPPHPVGARKPS